MISDAQHVPNLTMPFRSTSPPMQLLWLTYERPPHPDAVAHPVDEYDAAFVLDMLRYPYERRLHWTGQLAAYLASQQARPLADRLPVPCRTPGGLYRLVPWRLAKWLRHILPASDAAIRRAIAHIERWLEQPASPHEPLVLS